MTTRRYISSIRLENYGAFYGSGYPAIQLPKGENLLIYGENGSGKSSLYKALNDFFASANDTGLSFNINKRLDTAPGAVQLTFSEDEKEEEVNAKWVKKGDYTFSLNSTPPSDNAVSFIKQADLIRGFLSYKQLVQTYAMRTNDSGNPELYELIIEDLLWDHKLSDNRTIGQWWETLKPGLALRDGRYGDFNSAVTDLLKFNSELALLLDGVNRDTGTKIQDGILDAVNNWLLTYFGYDAVVSLQSNSPRVFLDESYDIQNTLKFDFFHYGLKFEKYQDFLNEARLSALAICIYLASIKLNPTGTNYKLLFLDDVFIGLDTSNRLPLLQLLAEQFGDFQIFVTTYDRNWFELAKTQLNPGNWKLMEIFSSDIMETQADGSEKKIGDKPVMIESDFSFIKKAEAYFHAKDYAASANYLRSELERIVKKILPLQYRVKMDESFGVRDETKLENLLNSLDKYFGDCNVSMPPRAAEAIRLYRKLVLNPQSHYDINSPIYKIEIEKAFAAVNEIAKLPEITRRLLVDMNTKFIYANTAASYSFEIELADNIEHITFGTTAKLSSYKFRINKWTWNGIDYAINTAGVIMAEHKRHEFCDQKRTLQDIFGVVNHSTKIPIPANPEQEIILSSGARLYDLLQI